MTAALTVPASSVSLAGAEIVLEAAMREAGRRGVAVTIAVLDHGGSLVALRRMDGVHIGTVTVAQAKAATVVNYRRPSAALHAGLAGGNMALLTLPDLVALPGGLPLLSGGSTVGSVGVSGAAPDVDEAIAAAGTEAFEHEAMQQ